MGNPPKKGWTIQRKEEGKNKRSVSRRAKQRFDKDVERVRWWMKGPGRDVVPFAIMKSDPVANRVVISDPASAVPTGIPGKPADINIVRNCMYQHEHA